MGEPAGQKREEQVRRSGRGIEGGRPSPDQRGTSKDAPAGQRQASPASAPATSDGFGPIEPGLTPDKARKDPLWVENGIVEDALSPKPPFTYTVRFNDGASLTIPLELMSYKRLTGPTVLLYRRHIATRRLVPFQTLATDPQLADPKLKRLSGTLVLQAVVPPRFDPALTPVIIAYLNQAQWLYLARSMLEVFQLQLMNPVIGGWRPRIAGTAGRGAAGAAGLSALQTEARALVQATRAANGKVVVNLAGTGEVAGAINVNPLIDQQVLGVPNLLKVAAEKVGGVIPAASVDAVVSNNVVFGQVNWAVAARGCFSILRSGGSVSIAPYTGQIEQHLAQIVQAFKAAGFDKVIKLKSFVTAVKP